MSQEMVSRASARVCLFGDHQDYLELPIIACSIDRIIEMRGVQNTTDEFHFKMIDMNTSRSFSIHEKFQILEKGDHIASVLRVLKRYDCIPDIGYTISVKGNIPINAGLSSSSAIVVAWIRFLLQAFGSSQEITKELVAQIAYEAEVLEHNSPGGKMDQYTIAIGDIIYLETDHYNYLEKFKRSIKGLIVAESGTPKDTMGLLKDRKTKALESIRIVKETIPGFDLQQALVEDISSYVKLIPKDLQPFFYAAIKNHEITKKALQVLRRGLIDHQEIGRLMIEHHKVLRDQLKITTPKIDAMIDAALQAGAYGAKIVGSGGGGSICVIAPVSKEQVIIEAIQKVSGEKVYAVKVVSVNDSYHD